SAALVAGGRDERVEHQRHSIDVLGALLLASGIISLLAAYQGRDFALVCVPLAAALLSLFFSVERRAAEPLLPLELFRRPVIAVSSAAGGRIGAAVRSARALGPLFLP